MSAPIRAARRDELEALIAIEREAGARLRGDRHARDRRRRSQARWPSWRPSGPTDAHGWRSTRPTVPIAYLLSAVVDGCAHVEQVSVAPAHARRGLGAALVDHLAAVAGVRGRPAVTLTTFRDVPWNAPYYERLGFTVVEPADQGPELRALVAAEAHRIPGDAPRVAMRRAV